MLDYLDCSICPISKPYGNFISLVRLGSSAILPSAIIPFPSRNFFFYHSHFLIFNIFTFLHLFIYLMVEIESWFFNSQSQSLKTIHDLNLFWCAQVSHRRYMYKKEKEKEKEPMSGCYCSVAVAPFYYHYHRSLCGKLHLLVIPSP